MPVDYVDYTLLQRKGILKIKEQPKSDNVKVDSGGFVDFTNASNQASSVSSAPASPSGDMFGFMDMGAMASGSGSTNSSQTSTTGTSSNTSSDSEVSTLKIKLEDTEYKLARLTEKLERIEALLQQRGTS